MSKAEASDEAEPAYQSNAPEQRTLDLIDLKEDRHGAGFESSKEGASAALKDDISEVTVTDDNVIWTRPAGTGLSGSANSLKAPVREEQAGLEQVPLVGDGELKYSSEAPLLNDFDLAIDDSEDPYDVIIDNQTTASEIPAAQPPCGIPASFGESDDLSVRDIHVYDDSGDQSDNSQDLSECRESSTDGTRSDNYITSAEALAEARDAVAGAYDNELGQTRGVDDTAASELAEQRFDGRDGALRNYKLDTVSGSTAHHAGETIAEHISLKTWAVADKPGRVSMCNDISRCIIQELSLDTGMPVLEFNTGETLGSTDRSGVHYSDQVLESDDPTDAIETLAHEYRHVWQYSVLDGAIEHPGGSNGIDFLTEGAKSYVDPDKDFDAYAWNPLEIDAESFARATSQAYNRSYKRGN